MKRFGRFILGTQKAFDRSIELEREDAARDATNNLLSVMGYTHWMVEQPPQGEPIWVMRHGWDAPTVVNKVNKEANVYGLYWKPASYPTAEVRP